MTELNVVSSFLAHLTLERPYLNRDVTKILSVTKFIAEKQRADVLSDFVGALLGFSKAIVAGVNSRRFAFTSKWLASRPQSCFPRFLGGLTCQIFTNDGLLRPDWSRDSLELILQILALVKRIKHPLTKKRADAKAVQEFIGYQSQLRDTDEVVVQNVKSCWKYFARDLNKVATLGFPGPGATLDERHPYSPEYSFLETSSIPSTKVALFYKSAFFNQTGIEYDDYQPNCSNSQANHYCRGTFTRPDFLLPAFYDFVCDPVVNTVCVDKNAVVSRLITITHVGNTILGATFRNSVKKLWKKHGVERLLNVHNQTLSHRTLERFFSEVSCLDLEGGSSCITNYLNSRILPPVLAEFIELTENSQFNVNGKLYDVNTQLMGDSVSTGLLTTTLFLCILDAFFRWSLVQQMPQLFEAYPELLYEYEMLGTDFDRCIQLIRDLPINVVGDDLVFPSYLEPFVRHNLSGIGVTVNEAKSSTADSNHKESCGAWFIKTEDGTQRIYPFRCPVGDTVPLAYQAATQFLLKTQKSTFAESLLVSLAHNYGSLLFRNTYTPDYIGSPMGSGQAMRIHSRVDTKSCIVNDSDAFIFGIKASQRCDVQTQSFSHSVGYRLSKRSPVGSVRYKTYRDPSRPRGSRHQISQFLASSRADENRVSPFMLQSNNELAQLAIKHARHSLALRLQQQRS
jgi:hypothetical protein